MDDSFIEDFCESIGTAAVLQEMGENPNCGSSNIMTTNRDNCDIYDWLLHDDVDSLEGLGRALNTVRRNEWILLQLYCQH